MASPDGLGLGPTLDLEALATWMQAQGLGEDAITNVRQLGGGTQNIVLRFTHAGRDYVLRRPPAHKRDGNDETMRREARILVALAESDVPHPRLIAACPDPEPLGAAFYLMEPVDGDNPIERPPDPAARHAFGLGMVDALIALSSVDVDAAGLGDLGRRDGWPERQVARWTRRLERYAETPGYAPPGGDVTARIAWWLECHQPLFWQPGLVHGDYHLANVMVHRGSGRVAAVIDWELASIGDPLLDLGELLVTWPVRGGGAGLFDDLDGLPTPSELISHYTIESDRDLEDLNWFCVLAGLRLGVILEETYVRALTGKAPRELGERMRTYATNLFNAASDRCHRQEHDVRLPD